MTSPTEYTHSWRLRCPYALGSETAQPVLSSQLTKWLADPPALVDLRDLCDWGRR